MVVLQEVKIIFKEEGPRVWWFELLIDGRAPFVNVASHKSCI